MFKFDFDLDDLTETDGQALPPNTPENRKQHDTQVQKPNHPCRTISVDELIRQLPPFISYSNCQISPEISIYKRELYDAKYQTLVNLMEEEEEEEKEEEANGEKEEEQETKGSKRTLNSLQSTSDLIPGVYEGGFKTWECSLDLAANLGSIVDRLKHHFMTRQKLSNTHSEKTFTFLEVGCGTAIPTASLCFQLFQYLLHIHCSTQTTTVNAHDVDILHENKHEPPILEIILQDFNSDVLKLLTFPNILLAFHRAKLSQTQNDGKQQEPTDEPKEEEETEENLEITDELKEDFNFFLEKNGIRLTLIHGPWSTFRLPRLSETRETDEESEGLRRKCQVILSSETLYCIQSIPDLIDLMINCKMPSNQQSHEQDQDQESTTILVASKSLYFGVGGGTHSFIKALEKYNASVTFIDIQNHSNSNGVSRALMNVQFAS